MAWTELTRHQHARVGNKYASDLTNAEWALIAPLMPPLRTTGRPRTTSLHDVFDTILYVATTGCQWRMLPNDFPPVSTIRGYLYAWRNDSLLDEMNRKFVALKAIGLWTTQINKRSDTAQGFEVLPRRWVVERTFGWLGRCRRLSKDWEKSFASAEAWVTIAHIRVSRDTA